MENGEWRMDFLVIVAEYFRRKLLITTKVLCYDYVFVVWEWTTSCIKYFSLHRRICMYLTANR